MKFAVVLFAAHLPFIFCSFFGIGNFGLTDLLPSVFSAAFEADVNVDNLAIELCESYEALKDMLLSTELDVVELKKFDVTPLQHFIMLKKTIKMDITHLSVLEEYIYFVSGSLNKPISSDTVLELLQVSLEEAKDPIILRALITKFGSSVSPEDGKVFYRVFCEYLRRFGIDGRKMLPLPFQFDLLKVTLKSVDPLGFFELTAGKRIGSVATWIRLMPVLFLFLGGDLEALPFAKAVLLGYLDQRILVILNEFVNISDFCSIYPDKSVFEGRAELFRQLLDSENVDELIFRLIEMKLTHLLEAVLLFIPSSLQRPEMQRRAVKDAICSQSALILSSVCLYRTITGDDLVAIYKETNLCTRLRDVFVTQFRQFLIILHDFDAELDKLKITEDDLIHPFPEPASYELIVQTYTFEKNKFDFAVAWLARLILARHFGIPLNSTAIKTDYDSTWTWTELAMAVNLFLDLKARVTFFDGEDGAKYESSTLPRRQVSFKLK